MSHGSRTVVSKLGVESPRVKLIGAPAKPRAMKGSHYICHCIDIQEVASVQQCGETERKKGGTKSICGWE